MNGWTMYNKDLETARTIAEKVRQAGGRTFFVGGIVRDRILNIENKDVDIEVHGVSCEKLAEILDSIGQRMQIGASFGIFGLKGSDVDIAMPRTEKATGKGHRDFSIFTDPFIGPEKAARRRDFTMNALMEDVLTGEILDYFGGVDDARAGVIRHVNDESFAEDPLRVLRGAQFAARFGFSLAPETAELCGKMDLSALPKERVFAETEKALLKAARPSIYFRVLKDIGQLGFWFPGLEALSGIEQNPRFHPEGDVFAHTMMVLDNAALLRDKAVNPLGLMFAALCHDLGKAETTQNIGGSIHAYRHETAGIELSGRFMKRLTNEKELRAYVCSMTELHMRPNMMPGQKAGDKAYMHLFDSSVCPDDLLLLSEADYLGCRTEFPASPDHAEGYEATKQLLLRKLRDYRQLMSKPYITGADLVREGIKPGPELGKALEYAHKLRLAGVDRETAVLQVKGYLKSL